MSMSKGEMARRLGHKGWAKFHEFREALTEYQALPVHDQHEVNKLIDDDARVNWEIVNGIVRGS